MSKKSYKYLFKNIGLLTISSFGTKILSFILVPIYTNYLTTSDYGTYDLYYTTISLLIPILTLNIVEAVMRFSLDEKTDSKDVFIIGFRRLIYALLVLSCLVILNYTFNVISIFNEYIIYFVLLFSGTLLYDFLSQFCRGLEKIKYVAIAGAINSITMLLLNVLFLVFFNLGLKGYFVANCIAFYLPILFLFFKLNIWKFFKKNRNEKLEKEMVKYSKPMIFNTIAWWINNVSDRYVVTWLCGVSDNGVYSVAYKIPSILNVFQTIFSQAWTISAVKEFNKENERFYCKIYSTYNCLLVLVCSILIIFDKLIAKLFFAKDFYMAWKYAPFLMISVIFGALSGFLGGIFSAVKNSKLYAKTTILGAVLNIIFNIILVEYVGPIGAAISTLISYSVVWIARLNTVKKYIDLNINIKRDIVSYGLMIIQSSILLLQLNNYILFSIEGILFLIIIVLYNTEIIKSFKYVGDFISKKGNK